jgi:hypothetical protein
MRGYTHPQVRETNTETQAFARSGNVAREADRFDLSTSWWTSSGVVALEFAFTPADFDSRGSDARKGSR